MEMELDPATFPIASRSLVRAHEEAMRLGLVCVAKTFPLLVGEDFAGQNKATLTLDVPQSEGPIVVTDLFCPETATSTHHRQTMRQRVNGEWLDDGPVSVSDALTIPRTYCGRLPSSPVVIGAAQQYQLVLEDAAVAYAAEEGAQVKGVTVRYADPARRSLCPVPTDLAELWAHRMRLDGQAWGLTVRYAGTQSRGTPVVTTSQDAIVECVILTQEMSAVEGTVVAADVQAKVGPDYVTPGVPGPILGPLILSRRVIVMPGLRWPVPGGTQVSMQVTYPAGTPLPVTLTLIGRRGGYASGCFA